MSEEGCEHPEEHRDYDMATDRIEYHCTKCGFVKFEADNHD